MLPYAICIGSTLVLRSRERTWHLPPRNPPSVRLGHGQPGQGKIARFLAGARHRGGVYRIRDLDLGGRGRRRPDGIWTITPALLHLHALPFTVVHSLLSLPGPDLLDLLSLLSSPLFSSLFLSSPMEPHSVVELMFFFLFLFLGHGCPKSCTAGGRRAHVDIKREVNVHAVLQL